MVDCAGLVGEKAGHRGGGRGERRYRPRVLDRLEDRVVPAFYYWTGAVNGLWSNAGNWLNNTLPVPGPSTRLVFLNDSMSRQMTNDLAGLSSVGSLTFDDGGFTLTGNPLEINGVLPNQEPGIASQVGANTILVSLSFTVPSSAVIGSFDGSSLVLGAPMTVAPSVTLGLYSELNSAVRVNAPITAPTSSVVALGRGLISLTTPNNYTGGTSVNGPTLSVSDPNALGTGPVTFLVGALETTTSLAIANPYTVTADDTDGFVFSNSAGLMMTGPGRLDGLLTMPFSTTQAVTLTGALSGPGRIRVGVDGASTPRVILAGANSFTGGVENSGQIRIDRSDALGTGIYTSLGGSLVFGNEFGIGNIVRIRNGTIDAAGRSVGLAGAVELLDQLNVTTSGGRLTIGGPLSGPGNLNKVDPGGHLLLTGNSAGTGTIRSFLGTTTVLANASGMPVQLLGGVLSGTGEVGATNVVGAGTISPGVDGPGTLEAWGAVTLNPAATLHLDLNGTGPGTGHDQLIVQQGGINLAGARLSAVGQPLPAATSLTIVASPGGVAGTFQGLPDGTRVNFGGTLYRIQYLPTSVVLNSIGSVDTVGLADSVRRLQTTSRVDITGDGVPDFLRIRGNSFEAIDGRTNRFLRRFLPFQGPASGLTITATDFDGDGRPDLIFGAATSVGPQVRIYRVADGALMRTFTLSRRSTQGGVRVAVRDANLDGRADVVVGTGPRWLQRVTVINPVDGGIIYDQTEPR